MSLGYRLLLLAAALFHLSLLLSWRVGFWNGYTFDSAATQGWRGWDFFAVYQAGHNLRSGVSIYESDNERIEVVAPRYTPYRYLPFVAITIGWPLSAMPPLWAYRLWLVLVECVLLACAWDSWMRPRAPSRGALCAAMWLVFTPFYLELYMGQFSLLQAAMLLVILVALASSSRRAERTTTLSWGLSLLWKQNTALLAPIWIKLGRWRALVVAGVAVVALSLPYYVWDPSGLPSFLGNLRAPAPAPALGNLGARQALYSLLSALAPRMGQSEHIAAQWVWLGGVLLATLWITWRARKDAVPLVGLWMTTYFMVYHHVWEHHYVMLLPVYVSLYRRTGDWRLLLLYGLTAVWTPYRLIDPQGLAALDASMRWTPLSPAWVDVAYHASKALPTLLLWAYLGRDLLRRERAA